jgi:hypothetical protein
MSRGESKVIRDEVNSELLGAGIEPKVAAHISNIASLYTFEEDGTDSSLSQEEILVEDSMPDKDLLEDTIEASVAACNELFGFEAGSEIHLRQITTNFDVSVNETTNITVSSNDPNNSKIEEIFSQIDLAQARIIKDQVEIQSLAEEADELLNQLEYKAS